MSPESKTANHLGDLLEAADPIDESLLGGASIASALDEFGDAITRKLRAPVRAGGLGKRARRRPRKPHIALLVGLALIVVGSAVGGAAVLTARTGQFPTKAEVTMGGPGEALDPAAQDFREVALGVASDIPYPAAYESWRDFLISDEIRTTAGAGVESTGALHGWFAASAFCAWVHTWRQAELAGNTTAAAAAAAVISNAPTWKAVTDEDPHPDPTVQGDGGSIQYTLFGWMLPYRQAVLAGDRDRVEHLLATGYGDKCWTSDPEWRAQLSEHREWGNLSRSKMAEEYRAFLASARS